jgi:Flp pilus assembly protein TadD
LFQQHKYELVLELDWIKAVADDPFLRTLKGRCLYELRRYAEAVHEMVALINMGHGTLDVWYHLVRCYQRLGKSDHARQALSQALRLFPNDESLKRLAGA